MLYNTTTKTAPKQIKNINIPGEIFVLSATTIGDMDVLASGGRNIGNWYWDITDPNEVNDVGYSYAGAFSPGNPRTYNIPWVGNYSYSVGGGNMGYPGAWIINMTTIADPAFKNKNPPNRGFGTQYVSINADDKWIFTGSTGNYFEVWDNSKKETAPPKLMYAKQYFLDGGDGNQIIPYSDGSDNLYVSKHGTNITIINMTNASAPTKKQSPPVWFNNKIAYDPVRKIVYGWVYNPGTNQNTLKQLDVSDPNNMHLNAGSIQITDMQPRNIARNGTDVFVVGRVGANVRMYSFDNPSAPRLVDSAYTMEGDAEAVEFYKGYLYTAYSNVLTVYKVIPSSSIPPNIPQQTMGSQDQKTKQQSTSSGGGDQNIITQVAGLWNRVVNFVIRHFPFH
jgi:hypothetical protein